MLPYGNSHRGRAVLPSGHSGAPWGRRPAASVTVPKALARCSAIQRGMKKSMRRVRGGFRWGMGWVLPLLLAACAGQPRDVTMSIDDPNEHLNRHVMAANQEV